MIETLQFILEVPINEREARRRSVAKDVCKVLISSRTASSPHSVTSLVDVMFRAKKSHETLLVRPELSFVPVSGVRSAFDPSFGDGIVNGKSITFSVSAPEHLRGLMQFPHAESLVALFASSEADAQEISQTVAEGSKNDSDETVLFNLLQQTGNVCFFASSHQSWEVFMTIAALKDRWLPLLGSYL